MPTASERPTDMHYSEDAEPAYLNPPSCILCGSSRTRGGEIKHEPTCPHFMRGPDPGGDPHEWPTLLDAVEYDLQQHSRKV